jgi:hypothetical protein
LSNWEIETLQRGMQATSFRPVLLAALGHAYGQSGRKEEAQQIMADLRQFSADHYIAPLYPAMIALGMGDEDLAMTELEKAFDQRSSWLVFAGVDPRWNRLRSNSRFQLLLSRIGLKVVGATA